MDDEVDVEGEDETVFGAVQFTEEDILALDPDTPHELENVDADIDIEAETHADDSQELKPLRDLVAEGKIVKRQTTAIMEVKRNMEEVMGVAEVDRVEQAVKAARMKGDGAALIAALESKVKCLVSFLARRLRYVGFLTSWDRSHHGSLRRNHLYAVYVWILIRNLRCQLGVGIHAVDNAGCAA